MGRLNAAYAVLSDPVRRTRYHAYYTKSSRTTGAPKSGGGRASTSRTGAPRWTGSQHRVVGTSTDAGLAADRSAMVLLVSRILLGVALAAVMLLLVVMAWLAF